MNMHYGRITLSFYDAPKELIDLLGILFPVHQNNDIKWVTLVTEKVDITFFQEEEPNEPKP